MGAVEQKLAYEYERVALCGLELQNIDEQTCAQCVVDAPGNGRGVWVITANSDIARLASQDKSTAHLMAQADLVVADGMPLIWASRIQGTPIVERVCGSNLVWSIAERAASRGLSLFLLGGGLADTAERAGSELRRRYGNLAICGTYCPRFGFENDEVQLQEIRDALAFADPDIVYVALGFPKAERLIARLRGEHPKTSWIGVGISLGFIAGDVRRAPRWMQIAGLEWCHRLIQEPGRLAARYLWHDIPFVIRLLLRSWMVRLGIARPRGTADLP